MVKGSENKAVSGVRQAGAAPLPVVRGARRRGGVVGHAVPERVRAQIKTAQLVKMLTDTANGVKQVEPHQVTAAIALLRKVLPDLQATLLSGDPQLPLTIITRME
jgi:hypothetical protein